MTAREAVEEAYEQLFGAVEYQETGNDDCLAVADMAKQRARALLQEVIDAAVAEVNARWEAEYEAASEDATDKLFEAVAAERNRCAGVCEARAKRLCLGREDALCLWLAKTIREGGDENDSASVNDE